MAFAQLTHRESLRDDVNVLDHLLPEPGAIYVMDRAYLDFQRLFALTLAAAFFVIRSKTNTRYRRRYSQPVDKTTGLICDQTVVLTGARTAERYPQPLRRIKYRDPQTHTTLEFLTNHFTLPALTITELYTILQILSLTLFEKAPLYQLLTQTDYKTEQRDILNQLNLFD